MTQSWERTYIVRRAERKGCDQYSKYPSVWTHLITWINSDDMDLVTFIAKCGINTIESSSNIATL